MKKILLLLLLLIILLGSVLWTKTGQKNVLLPVANLLLKQKVKDHRVVLSRLEPGFASLDLEGTVDGSIRFRAEGPVNWLSRHFELSYRIEADNILVKQEKLPLPPQQHQHENRKLLQKLHPELQLPQQTWRRTRSGGTSARRSMNVSRSSRSIGFQRFSNAMVLEGLPLKPVPHIEPEKCPGKISTSSGSVSRRR